jgi:hypothetical protein
MSTLNCRTLSSKSAKAELNKLMSDIKISLVCIQEHRIMHKDDEPDIVAHNLGNNTLFSASAVKNSSGSTIGGTGIVIRTSLLPLVSSINKISERIVAMVIRGNPKTIIVSCHSPHNVRPESEVEEFYSTLNSFVQSTPLHAMLLVGGDFNARIDGNFSYHSTQNRNGVYLNDFVNQNNLVVGNTTFQKPMQKLWTWRSPKGDLAQIDFCLYRKRWRNSINDCQAFSSSNPIGSDHRIVSTKIHLSVRTPKLVSRKQLYWRAISEDLDLANTIDTTISQTFEDLPEPQKNYTSFVKICNRIGIEKLPPKPPYEPAPVDNIQVSKARKATLRSSTKNLQAAQTQLKRTYDKCEDERISKTLLAFETKSLAEQKKAWKLVRELSGKKSGVIFIQGENRLDTWKNHFSKLLSADVQQSNSSRPIIVPLFDTSPDISCDPFSQAEVDTTLKLMKAGKAPGLDGLPVELWRLPKVRESLTTFCNQTLSGNRPTEWGLSGIVPVPKKGNLTLPDNYRGISLTQVAAKIYNRLLLNRLRPVIDKLLRPNQNGFRPSRSTSSQILALRRIVEEVLNHKKEAVLVFIDFRKAFDSIDRNTMFEILSAYGVPSLIVDAIRIMYINTSATVLTPEGETDTFNIDTGVLQGDPLAPFLFIVTLDYALRNAINNTDGLTLKRRLSPRHPAKVLSDLDFADDICLMEDTVDAAQDLLHRVERATQEIGLYLNASKTKFIRLNPSANASDLLAIDGSRIDEVEDFKYLGSYTNTAYDMKIRIGQAWGASHALTKVWKAPIRKATKLKVFKSCVESILLYGSESWTLTKTLSKKLDGNYTRLLRAAQNISWKSHTSNKKLYNGMPQISSVVRNRRLALAGHVMRHDEMAAKVLLWHPDAKRRLGRPSLTLKKIIEEDVELQDADLLTALLDRVTWKDLIVSPTGVG